MHKFNPVINQLFKFLVISTYIERNNKVLSGKLAANCKAFLLVLLFLSKFFDFGISKIIYILIATKHIQQMKTKTS